MGSDALNVSANSVVIVGLDVVVGSSGSGGSAGSAGSSESEKEFERRHFICSGAEYLSGNLTSPKEITAASVLLDANQGLFKHIGKGDGPDKVFFVLYPTRTYSTSDDLFSDIAPEDRKLIRKIQGRYPQENAVQYFKVPLSQANVFERMSGYLGDEKELQQFRAQQIAVPPKKPDQQFPVAFDISVPAKVIPILKSCITKPNKQDWFYVYTKSLGINLVIKLAFATFGVLKGTLPLYRAIITTIWYQSQDVFFTVFGQTYMKFLGKMSRMLRVGRGYFGDLMFTYIQFSCFEFINRLILGPVGENPLVYTWAGVGLILFNNLQGLIAGGPMTPAVVRVRRSGVISHKTMMHIYQLGGLTFHFGLFASFGYQTIFTVLTTSLMVVSWGTFLTFSIFFKDPPFQEAKGEATVERLDALVGRWCTLDGTDRPVVPVGDAVADAA
ncbi:MAG: hypothetical protein H6729_16910 [Deltaproteobacteria bacterium]|nr:hypothetical protein [Deltaproteobacteria bacterium]